jgi:hypothetical protein
MGRDRADINELRLQGSPNLSRALKLQAEKPLVLPHREELEAMFAEIKQRHDRALADIAERGDVITVTKYTSKGHAYTIEQVNPYVRIAQKCEQQLAALAKLLTKFPAQASAGELPKNAIGRTHADLIARLQKEVAS